MPGVREVNAILDLVRREAEHIEGRFLARPAATAIFSGNAAAKADGDQARLPSAAGKQSRLRAERHEGAYEYIWRGMTARHLDVCRERLFRIFDAKESKD